jgi:N-acetylglutamate synthase-like GNAT family acetyltransferase
MKIVKGKQIAMSNPKMTGISGITGRIVYIRHATDWDMVMIGKTLKRLETSEDRLTADNVVVAVEEDRIIGFAILEKPITALHGTKQEGCVTIFEDNRRRGIGALVVGHLMEFSPAKSVYTASGRPEYFRKAGFTKEAKVPVKSIERTSRFCQLPGKRGEVVMKYERVTRHRSKTA